VKAGGRRVRRTLLGLLLSATFGLLAVPLAPAVTAAASTTGKVTNCKDSGKGSLRQAVAEASSGDTISFRVPRRCTAIKLKSGPIQIGDDITIAGPGPGSLAVSGDNLSQVFLVAQNADVLISGLTIEDGTAANDPTDGIRDVGGAINNQGSLTLTDTTVSHNDSATPPTGGAGGGIANQLNANLTLLDSTVSGNTSYLGGGIYNAGNLLANNSTISDNDSAGQGTGAGGGGIANGGTATINDSTISGNTAVETGGGIYNFGTMTLSESTVADNVNGGIASASKKLTLMHVTVADNSGDGIYETVNSPKITASIVANNTPKNCSTDLSHFVASGQFDLDSDGSCLFDRRTDLSDVKPFLAGLQNNGGPTDTIAVEEGSPAIGHVRRLSLCPSVDQRGFLQTVPCDIGAYDGTAGPPPQTPETPVVVALPLLALVVIGAVVWTRRRRSGARTD
jgi:hypothetical protein